MAETKRMEVMRAINMLNTEVALIMLKTSKKKMRWVKNLRRRWLENQEDKQREKTHLSRQGKLQVTRWIFQNSSTIIEKDGCYKLKGILCFIIHLKKKKKRSSSTAWTDKNWYGFKLRSHNSQCYLGMTRRNDYYHCLGVGRENLPTLLWWIWSRPI